MVGVSPPGNREHTPPKGRPVVAAPHAGTAQDLARYKRAIPDLRHGEKVVLLQRQHPAVLARKLVAPVVLLGLWAIGLAFVLPFIASLQPEPFEAPPEGVGALLPSLAWFGYIGIAVALVLISAYRVLDWTDDWIALTSRRLIIMEKALIFREARREVPIGRVQNVTAEYPTGLSVAFDFGELRVDTAGIGVLQFPNLPRPKRMREAIFAQQEALRAEEVKPEDRRKAAVRSILLGTDPELHERPTPPDGYTVVERLPVRSGYTLFNVIFPVAPQRDGDRVVWHHHWSYLARGLIAPVLLPLLVIGAWLVLIFQGEGGQYGQAAIIAGWVAVVLTPVCILWALWRWEDWRNDLYILDNDKVYDIERLPLALREQSKQTLISRVTDVTYVVPSPLAHLLNYGHVVLKTPGESTEFSFIGVPRPREVQQEIMERVEEYRAKSGGTDQEIEAWLRAYHDVQQEGR